MTKWINVPGAIVHRWCDGLPITESLVGTHLGYVSYIISLLLLDPKIRHKQHHFISFLSINWGLLSK